MWGDSLDGLETNQGSELSLTLRAGVADVHVVAGCVPFPCIAGISEWH